MIADDSTTELQQRVRQDLALIREHRSDAEFAALLHTTPSKLRAYAAEPERAPAGFFDTLAEICILRHNAIAFSKGPQAFTVTPESAHFLDSSELYAEVTRERTKAAWARVRDSLPTPISEREVQRRVDAWLARNPCERRDPARSLQELSGRLGKPVDRLLRDLGFTLDHAAKP
jgi:hypothetical protein